MTLGAKSKPGILTIMMFSSPVLTISFVGCTQEGLTHSQTLESEPDLEFTSVTQLNFNKPQDHIPDLHKFMKGKCPSPITVATFVLLLQGDGGMAKECTGQPTGQMGQIRGHCTWLVITANHYINSGLYRQQSQKCHSHRL